MAKLNQSQSSRLKNSMKAVSNLKSSPDLCEFFDLFFVCEASARKLVEYYHAMQPYSTTDIRKALKYFSLKPKVSDTILDQIFKSGNGKRGNKTCRQLRNDYVHHLSEDDKKEIEKRINDLKKSMQEWVDFIKIV